MACSLIVKFVDSISVAQKQAAQELKQPKEFGCHICFLKSHHLRLQIRHDAWINYYFKLEDLACSWKCFLEFSLKDRNGKKHRKTHSLLQ